MILRMTFNDNDQMEILESYLNGFHDNLLFDLNDASERMSVYMKLRPILNPNNPGISDEDKDFLVGRIDSSVREFISKRCPSSKEYLLRNLEFEFVSCIEDKCENGEVVYWLQYADKVVVL